MAASPPGDREIQQNILAALNALQTQIQALEVPKRKDFWDKFSVISSFSGSVLLAAVGFLFTHSYQQEEAAARAAREVEQQRRDEIELTTKLIPLIASSEAEQRRLAREMLLGARRRPKDVLASAVSGAAAPPSAAPAAAPPVLDHFIQIALADTKPDRDRTVATQKIASIALDKSAPVEVRERATSAIARIAALADGPVEARDIAAQALSDLKLVTAEQAVAALADHKFTRRFDEVMLHHSFRPAVADFDGKNSVVAMARFAIEHQKWSHAPWHYLIAPDGGIWLGRPLNSPGLNAPGRNATGFNVTLVLDGEREQPTAAQERAAGILLSGLIKKVKLLTENQSRSVLVFHSDYSPKTCPGRLVSKDNVQRWIAAADSADPRQGVRP